MRVLILICKQQIEMRREAGIVICLSLLFSVSLSLTRTHTHTHAHIHTQTQTQTHTHTHTYTHTQKTRLLSSLSCFSFAAPSSLLFSLSGSPAVPLTEGQSLWAERERERGSRAAMAAREQDAKVQALKSQYEVSFSLFFSTPTVAPLLHPPSLICTHTHTHTHTYTHTHRCMPHTPLYLFRVALSFSDLSLAPSSLFFLFSPLSLSLTVFGCASRVCV